MNIKKKFLLGFYLIFLICIMCGCGLSDQDNAHKNTDSNKENMYNNNNEIVQQDNNYTYATCRDSIKNNQIEINYTAFSGIDTICFLEVKEDSEITFNYNSTVDKGNFKSVLINPKNEVETILEGTEQSNKTIKLTKGRYSFKNVGANSYGKLKISISSNSNVEITRDKK